MTSTKITVQTHSINHHRWLMWVALWASRVQGRL